jgi:hypothetical protein
MNVSVPLLVLAAISVFVAYRLGLKAWHAVACLVLGFLLSTTAAAPAIDSVLTGLVHWAQAQLSGGKAVAR